MYDAVWLISNVKNITSGMDKSNKVYVGLFQNIKSLFAMKQQQHKTADAYYKRFEGNMQTLNICEVKISDHTLLQVYEENLTPLVTRKKPARQFRICS